MWHATGTVNRSRGSSTTVRFREYAGMPPALGAEIEGEGNAKAFDACAEKAAPGASIEIEEEGKPGECWGGCVYPASAGKQR